MTSVFIEMKIFETFFKVYFDFSLLPCEMIVLELNHECPLKEGSGVAGQIATGKS